MIPDVLSAIVEELRQRYGCHTVVLYGSRARGEHTEASDWDVVAVRASGPEVHDARDLGGALLDAFVVSEADALGSEPGAIRFRHGQVLVERDGWGRRLVEHAARLYRQGPAPLEPVEVETLRAWVTKTLARVERDDLEARHRRAWLLHDLPEICFKLRGRWYPGPKEAFRWLREHDPAAYALFEQALTPAAPLSSVRRLADHVLAAG